MQDGTLPRWLYALPWWGTPSGRRPFDWALYTMRHEFIVTLDELPPFGHGNIAPHVGILSPLDDGSAWYPDQRPAISAYATDRGGRVQRVDFYADDVRIASDDSAPYGVIWAEAPAIPVGCYDITAVATDDAGEHTTSNKVRISVGLVDLARGKAVVVSSGQTPDQAVDGDYHTVWSSENADDAWIYVDLGDVHRISRVNLLWGWKIHASDFSIDVAVDRPDDSDSWTTVHEVTDRPYVAWEATDRIVFAPVPARYVRMHATKRAGRQTWAGYHLAAFEVSVPVQGISDRQGP